ncbi:MAG TPA: 1-phosphofructokinase [Meiothermus sp.]|nr:1-phosphofructokinase [Meiothermus sp.]
MIHTLTLNPALDLRMRLAHPRLGELNRAQSVALEPSGKGLNVARALARQHFPVRAVLPLGGLFGQVVEQLALGIELAAVPIAGATRCNVKVADTSSGSVTEFNAPGPTLQPTEWEAVQKSLFAPLRPGDAVVLAGSLPPGLQSDTYAELTTQLVTRGARVFLDTEGESLRIGLEARPHLIKPNREEAEHLLGTPIQATREALEAARALQAKGAERVVLSLGAEGAVFVGPEGAVLAAPPQIQPYSTVGCGDALLAGAVAGLTQGLTWAEVARQATAWAVARALVRGSEFPTLQEVQGVIGDVMVKDL